MTANNYESARRKFPYLHPWRVGSINDSLEETKAKISRAKARAAKLEEYRARKHKESSTTDKDET